MSGPPLPGLVSTYSLLGIPNWEGDVYFFGNLAEDEAKIKKVLDLCDYYSCECRWNAESGRAVGFRGEILPIIPNGGGFHIDSLARLREKPTSNSRLITSTGDRPK